MVNKVQMECNSLSFASLGSGSGGNCSVVALPGCAVLIDCGLSCRQVRLRLEQLDVPLADLRAILITHEHSDHVQGLRVTARDLGLPVYISAGTRAALQAGKHGLEPSTEQREVRAGASFEVGELLVEPFAVPHDSREPLAYVVGRGDDRVVVATDIGHPTDLVIEQLARCRVVQIEFNHDLEMLLAGDYPSFLKERIRGPEGHLSNAQACSIVEQLRESRVEHLRLAHLSSRNNSPDLALRSALDAVGGAARERISVDLALQDTPSARSFLTEVGIQHVRA